MTYDYHCVECDGTFEVEQRISEPRGAKCPHCGTFSENRLISCGGGFSLKGGGWAADNYSSQKGDKS